MLPPFPAQPDDVPWPTGEWAVLDPDPTAVDVERLDGLVARAFTAEGEAEMGTTLATVCAHRGAIVAEQYGTGVDPKETLASWSMAKSITAAIAGILVDEGRLSVDEPVGWPAWSAPDDPRAAVTVDHLLQMRPSLEWLEEYTADGASDVVAMLFGDGQLDMAAFTADKPLVDEPGAVWCYSSGTTNLLAWVLGQRVGGGADGMRSFMDERLFTPIGITSALPKFDGAGTFIGSSYCFATARDFARFGLLFQRGGEWDGRVVVSREWVDACRTPQADVLDEGWGYGRQWWTRPEQGGLYGCRGYQGQFIVCAPASDVVVVRSGISPEDVWPRARDWVLSVVDCFAA